MLTVVTEKPIRVARHCTAHSIEDVHHCWYCELRRIRKDARIKVFIGRR